MHLFLGSLECMKRMLLLPMCAVSVCQSVCLSVCHAIDFGGACSVCGVILCSLCQITLAPCFTRVRALTYLLLTYFLFQFM